jgi:hypothetical protein
VGVEECVLFVVQHSASLTLIDGKIIILPAIASFLFANLLVAYYKAD